MHHEWLAELSNFMAQLDSQTLDSMEHYMGQIESNSEANADADKANMYA